MQPSLFDDNPAPHEDDNKAGSTGEPLPCEHTQEELEALRARIRYHDRLYYVDSRPEISDSAYDALFRQLLHKEAQFPHFITPQSPTQRVGTPSRSQFAKHHHASPMLSLDSELNMERVRAFDTRVRRELDCERVEYTAEPKYDGLSVELLYERGVFIRGATRGDGLVGEDVTANLQTIRSLPLHMNQSTDKKVVIRGEVYVRLHDFQALNRQLTEKGEEPFANPRNAASGSLRQLDSTITATRPLVITCYDLVSLSRSLPDTHWDALSQLGDWGFPIPLHRQLCHGIEDAIVFHQEIGAIREQLPFEIDGIVIKINAKSWQQALGAKSRSPRWAIAYKFPPRKEITQVDQIVISVGRTGALTPIALLRPVEIGGVTISRATLHNAEEVARKDIRVGDTVKVERAGDVIPDVVERIPISGQVRSASLVIPAHCPVCGSTVVCDGPIAYCTGQTVCRAQLKGAIEHYGSKRAMNIEGLGRKTVAQLVDRGLVQDLADLYTLTQDQLQALEGFADRSAFVLHEAIRQSKQASFDRFVFGLGIRHVGLYVSRVLVASVGSLDRLIQTNRNTLEQIKDIGSKIAIQIEGYFQEPRNLTVLERMRDLGVIVTTLDITWRSVGQTLKGKNFVFTGGLEKMTRQEAKARIEHLGGRVTSTVSKQTTYVVVGKDPGSKLDDARRLGVEILSEENLMAVCDEGMVK